MFNKIRQKRSGINALRNYSDEQNVKYLQHTTDIKKINNMKECDHKTLIIILNTYLQNKSEYESLIKYKESITKYFDINNIDGLKINLQQKTLIINNKNNNHNHHQHRQSSQHHQMI